MSFATLPFHLRLNALLYCGVKDLTRCSCSNRLLSVEAQNTARAILSIILKKYFPDYSERSKWPVSPSALYLLREICEKRIYVLNEFTLHELNTRSLAWKRCSNSPRNRFKVHFNFYNGSAYAINTEPNRTSETVSKFCPLSGKWDAVPDLPQGILLAANTVVNNGQLYAIGGATLGSFPNQIFVLTVTTSGTYFWKPLDVHPPKPLMFMTVVSFRDQIWMTGVTKRVLSGDNVTEEEETFIFDPAAGTFVSGPSPGIAGQLYGAFVVGDYIYAMGGNYSAQQGYWIRCGGQHDSWEVVSYFAYNKVTSLLAVQGDKVICFYRAGQRCDAYSFATEKWDSELVAGNSNEVVAHDATRHNATRIVLPPELRIDYTSSVVSYPSYTFKWG